MIKNRKVLFSMFLIVMIISIIGVVSASDDMNEDTAAEPITASNENTYAKNVEPNEVVSDSTNKGNSFKNLFNLSLATIIRINGSTIKKNPKTKEITIVWLIANTIPNMIKIIVTMKLYK